MVKIDFSRLFTLIELLVHVPRFYGTRQSHLRYSARNHYRIPIILCTPCELNVRRARPELHRPNNKKINKHIITYKTVWHSCMYIRTLYLLIPLPRASMVSMSKWFVGSSSTRKFGIPMHMRAKATRDFCPPDRLPTVCKAISPDTPKLPNCLRYSSTGLPEHKCIYVTY